MSTGPYYDIDRRRREQPGDTNPGDDDFPTLSHPVAGYMNHPITHHGNVAEYQASGFPYVITLDGAQDDTLIKFPFVTQWICVSGLGADAFFAFKSGSSSDTSGNAMKFCVQETNGASPPIFHVRCVDLYVTGGGAGGISVAAGMTSVPRKDFPDIAGLEGVKTATLNSATVPTADGA